MAISTLNPHAPLFVPSAYLAAEDFSPVWWQLVQTCPAFREYWIKECSHSYHDTELPSDLDLDLDLELQLNSDLDDSLLFDGADLEDLPQDFESLAVDDSSDSPFLSAQPKLHDVRALPSCPPSQRILTVDVHGLDVKGSLRDLTASKQRKNHFASSSPREKVPQIVTSNRMKSPRKIQQPR